jgi:molybdenum-dependent DNA-binding transcriptional regulator ModE
MRLRQIEVFHAIYTSGSMTNAARLLNVSQPSVSKVLAHAEQQLGYLLFDRVKGKLVATPEADRLFGLVSNVYEHVEQLRHVAENLRASDVGKVRIAASPHNHWLYISRIRCQNQRKSATSITRTHERPKLSHWRTSSGVVSVISGGFGSARVIVMPMRAIAHVACHRSWLF